jgi:hypothetical protein
MMIVKYFQRGSMRGSFCLIYVLFPQFLSLLVDVLDLIMIINPFREINARIDHRIELPMEREKTMDVKSGQNH